MLNPRSSFCNAQIRPPQSRKKKKAKKKDLEDLKLLGPVISAAADTNQIIAAEGNLLSKPGIAAAKEKLKKAKKSSKAPEVAPMGTGKSDATPEASRKSKKVKASKQANGVGTQSEAKLPMSAEDDS